MEFAAQAAARFLTSALTQPLPSLLAHWYASPLSVSRVSKDHAYSWPQAGCAVHRVPVEA
ncbi:hypothetical protein GCM10020229_23320 [Kitasatospora albolonga]